MKRRARGSKKAGNINGGSYLANRSNGKSNLSFEWARGRSIFAGVALLERGYSPSTISLDIKAIRKSSANTLAIRSNPLEISRALTNRPARKTCTCVGSLRAAFLPLTPVAYFVWGIKVIYFWYGRVSVDKSLTRGGWFSRNIDLSLDYSSSGANFYLIDREAWVTPYTSSEAKSINIGRRGVITRCRSVYRRARGAKKKTTSCYWLFNLLGLSNARFFFFFHVLVARLRSRSLVRMNNQWNA